MDIFKVKDYKNLITGSLFFGTGGGGSPQEARAIYKKIKGNIELKELKELKDGEIVVSAFGVGSIEKGEGYEKQIKSALAVFKEYVNKKISGVVPVEIGPESLAVAMDLAHRLGVPLVDADIVGGRSSPEIFLETITLFGISRTPCVVADKEGNCAILVRSRSPVDDETFLRNFTAMSGGNTYIVGYPLKVNVLKKALVRGTVTLSKIIGEKLNNGMLHEVLNQLKGKIIFTGIITKIKNTKHEGFTMKDIYIRNGKTESRVFIKNENLICWVNDSVALTCPDLIIFLNQKNKPLYNLDLKRGLYVKIIGIPAPNLWRSREGLKLFNPKLFGFPFSPVLLK